MKNLISLFICCILVISSLAQEAKKYTTKTGKIDFYSNTPIEKIEAVNNQVNSIIKSNGEMVFAVLIKGFVFPKALMQEHFNENYMESDKFPRAQFKGKLTNPSAVDWFKDGEYNVEAEGELTIHGVSQQVKIPGTISIKNAKPSLKSSFMVKCADYKIAIPSVVKDKIAESIEVRVDCVYEPS